MKSIGLRYKHKKARLVQEMKDSTDHLQKSANVPIRTCHKCKAPAEEEKAISSLQHQEMMGSTQTDCA